MVDALKHKVNLRWGVAFMALAVFGTVLFAVHTSMWDQDFTLLDQPMQVIAHRTVTNTFTVPSDAPYAINIYVNATARYVDCLLGQTGYPDQHCTSHPNAIDVTWLIYAKGGGVLHKGLSNESCCTYTVDRHGNSVVIARLGLFRVSAGTVAYVELRHRLDVSELRRFEPRVVIERSDPEESGLGTAIWSLLTIAALFVIGLGLLTAAWFDYRASLDSAR